MKPQASCRCAAEVSRTQGANAAGRSATCVSFDLSGMPAFNPETLHPANQGKQELIPRTTGRELCPRRTKLRIGADPSKVKENISAGRSGITSESRRLYFERALAGPSSLLRKWALTSSSSPVSRRIPFRSRYGLAFAPPLLGAL